MKDNLKLWNAVCKTDPKHTKKANVRGNNITSIAPQYQVMKATEQFGPYGHAWGFKHIKLDYTLVEQTGLVGFEGQFFYPNGEFPIFSSISAYRDGARTKPDQDFAKKIETDALTKALSKIGFSADVFMGNYDDDKYVTAMKEEFKELPPKPKGSHKMDQGMRVFLKEILATTSMEEYEAVRGAHEPVWSQVMKEWPAYMNEISGEQTKSFKVQIGEHKKRVESDDEIFKQHQADMEPPQ